MSEEEWCHNGRTKIFSKLNYLQYATQNPVSSVEMSYIFLFQYIAPSSICQILKSSKFLDASCIFSRVL